MILTAFFMNVFSFRWFKTCPRLCVATDLHFNSLLSLHAEPFVLMIRNQSTLVFHEVYLLFLKHVKKDIDNNYLPQSLNGTGKIKENMCFGIFYNHTEVL
jgi:hypothetical protein